MAYKCDICGKGKQFGHNVSFSQRKTAKVWKPNLQHQSIELEGQKLQIKVCTQCLRTLKKYRAADTEAADTEPTAKKSESPATKKTASKPKATATK